MYHAVYHVYCQLCNVCVNWWSIWAGGTVYQPGRMETVCHVYHVCNTSKCYTCIYCNSKQESTLLSVQNAPAEGQDRDRQGGSTPDTPPSVLNLQAESHVYLQGYCTASQDRDRLGRQAACKSVTGQGSQSGHFTTNPSL